MTDGEFEWIFVIAAALVIIYLAREFRTWWRKIKRESKNIASEKKENKI